MSRSKKITPELVEQIRGLAAEGRPTTYIARTVHRTKETVGMIMTEYQIQIAGGANTSIPQRILDEWDCLHKRYGKKERTK